MTIPIIFTAIGYALLGLFYATGGIHHFIRISFFAQMLDKRGVPLPKLVLVIGSLFQIVSGLLLALHIHTHAMAMGLAAFTVISSLMLLDFWNMSGAERQAVIRSWQSNLALTGALIVIGCA